METFEFAGGRFELAEPGELLASIGSAFEPVLHPSAPDGPVPGVAILIAKGAAGGQPRIRLRGQITVPARGFDRPEGSVHPAIVGAAYVAPLVDALTRLMTQPRGEDRPERRTTVHDPVSGLAGTLATGRAGFDGLITSTVETSIDAAGAGPAEVMAFVRMAFDAARRQAGHRGDASFLAGRTFVISRYPASDDFGAPSAVRLDQIGGLDDVVTQLRDVADSFRHPEVMARWGARRPQGILMWGPPGTGKTTLAAALATEIGGQLKEIRTPDILAKWVGQSEKNIKKVFTQARAYRTPTVLLFDEFDSIIGYLGSPQGAADQVANSVAGIFKQEMNGLIDANPNVIVVATTNFPQRVDESLIRSGRFDIKISVPLPDADGRTDILEKMLASLTARHDRGGFRMFEPDLDVEDLGLASSGMSGADLKELLRRVQMAKAMQEARGQAVTAITQDDLVAEIAIMRQRH